MAGGSFPQYASSLNVIQPECKDRSNRRFDHAWPEHAMRQAAQGEAPRHLAHYRALDRNL
jgi:hypothetical protein